MLKRISKPGTGNLRFPFLALLSSLPMMGFCIFASIQHEPAERFYNVAVYALIAALFVISGMASLASWGNGMAARVEELEEEIKKLKHPKE